MKTGTLEKTTPRADSAEVEIPLVELEIQGSAWACTACDPSDYSVALGGRILVQDPRDPDAEELVPAGEWLAHRFLLGPAWQKGVLWSEVAYSVSRETTECLILFDDRENGWAEWVQDEFGPLGPELLFLDNIKIAPEHRGKGLGLIAARGIIDTFAASDSLVACIPFPLQFANSDYEADPKQARDYRRSLAKLRSHWGRLGFRSLKRSSRAWCLSLTKDQPSVENVLRVYNAGRSAGIR